MNCRWLGSGLVLVLCATATAQDRPPLPGSCELRVDEDGQEWVHPHQPLSADDVALLARRRPLRLDLSVPDHTPAGSLVPGGEALEVEAVRLQLSRGIGAGDVAWLSSLRSVRGVTIGATGLSLAAARLLGGLASAETIRLEGVDLEAPAALGALGRAPRLRSLEVEGRGHRGGRSEDSHLDAEAARSLVDPAPPTHLARLALTQCRALDPRGLAWLARLPALRALDLTGSDQAATPEGLRALAPLDSTLTELRLCETCSWATSASTTSRHAASSSSGPSSGCSSATCTGSTGRGCGASASSRASASSGSTGWSRTTRPWPRAGESRWRRSARCRRSSSCTSGGSTSR